MRISCLDFPLIYVIALRIPLYTTTIIMYMGAISISQIECLRLSFGFSMNTTQINGFWNEMWPTMNHIDVADVTKWL